MTITISAGSVVSSIIRGMERLCQLPTTSIPANVAHFLKTQNELFAETPSTPTRSAIVSRTESLRTPCSSLTLRTFEDAFSASAAPWVARDCHPSNLSQNSQHGFTCHNVLTKPSKTRFDSACICFPLSRCLAPSVGLLSGALQPTLKLFHTLTPMNLLSIPKCRSSAIDSSDTGLNHLRGVVIFPFSPSFVFSRYSHLCAL